MQDWEKELISNLPPQFEQSYYRFFLKSFSSCLPAGANNEGYK